VPRRIRSVSWYGQDDSELPSLEAVAKQVRLTHAQVRGRLARAVPQLLGQPRVDAFTGRRWPADCSARRPSARSIAISG
jgi:hypothetical protein